MISLILFRNYITLTLCLVEQKMRREKVRRDGEFLLFEMQRKREERPKSHGTITFCFLDKPAKKGKREVN